MSRSAAPAPNDTPQWFRDALAVQPEAKTIDVDGTACHALIWGEPGGDPVMLVHGNGAHARWWSFIAPLLAAGRRIAAIDLGGMGDSGERPTYTPESFGRELDAWTDYLAGEGGKDRVGVAAHSFGGIVSTWWAGQRPRHLGRLVLLDVPFMDGGFTPEFRRKNAPPRVFATPAEALARFRLLPEQPCDNAFLVDYVALHSIRPVEGGWAWKLKANPWDYPGFQHDFWDRIDTAAAAIEVPLTAIRGELSELCPPAMEARWSRVLPAPLAIETLPGAHHHVMLDRPRELAARLDELL